MGSAVVRTAWRPYGRTVIAAGRGSRANRRAARRLPTQDRGALGPTSVERGAAERALAEAAPSAIIHLATDHPLDVVQDVAAAARRVNVEQPSRWCGLPKANHTLEIRAGFQCGGLAPVTHTSPKTSSAPPAVAPCEAYGLQKLEAEDCVVASSLDEVVAPVGGSPAGRPPRRSFSADSLYVGSALPIDGRTHVIDMRDATTALIAATTRRGEQ
ncbi:MAG: hypothetical protein U5N53_08985 [Mycobacterium sp.]|nr:hypothetical protein [Mycobacterium sp.]